MIITIAEAAQYIFIASLSGGTEVTVSCQYSFRERECMKTLPASHLTARTDLPSTGNIMYLLAGNAGINIIMSTVQDKLISSL